MKRDQATFAAGALRSATAGEPSARCAAEHDDASAAAWRELHAQASAPYRQAGRFAWHFARGKLGRDPVFRGLLERGELPTGARVVDIGCGQGLLASLLEACQRSSLAGRWPLAWGAAPHARSYHGIELMPRDVERARRATAGLALAPTFECADMRRAALPPCDAVVILDVLHYVDHAAQSALLVRVRDALLSGLADRHTGGGRAELHAVPPRLVLRVGDASSRGGYAISQWVDRAVTLVRGHRAPPTWGRPLAAWVALLEELGFRVRCLPMSRGTPFANVLLVAEPIGTA